MLYSLWYTNGLCKYLSDKGYVHFILREGTCDDFDSGKAFYFDTDKKEFGLLNLIPSNRYNMACALRDEFVKNKTLTVVEGC